MTFLLDSNACIEYLRGKNPKMQQKVGTEDPRNINLCSVVVTELLYGAHISARSVANLAKVRQFMQRYASLPFDDSITDIHSRIWAQLAKAGTIISPHDLQIAAIALAHGFTLVTHNTAEFKRVPNLLLDDWQV